MSRIDLAGGSMPCDPQSPGILHATRLENHDGAYHELDNKHVSIIKVMNINLGMQ